MAQSINKKINNNWYYNTQKGDQVKKIFFLWPTVLFSRKKIMNWDTESFSVFFGIFHYSFQYNFFKLIQDNKTSISKDNVKTLFTILDYRNLELDVETYHVKDIITYLQQNPYIVKIIRNCNPEHTYIQKLFEEIFKPLPFIRTKK